jgi:Fuc2NAc and GlcNAc transferase
VIPAVLLTAGFAATILLTGAVRRYALKRALLDIPNARSSHERPVPRGGGIVIAAVSLATVAGVLVAGWVPTGYALALLGGGIGISGVGWLDDHRDVPAWIRAAVHTAAATWVVAAVGGFPTLDAGVVAVPLGFFGHVLAAIGMVWVTNLFNFMDGIDGIAAGEAISVCAPAAIFLSVSGAPGLAMIAAVLAASSAGFLVWNWAPARIFMGDVGSGLLGFVIAALAVGSERLTDVPALVWLVLLAFFFVDATVTLLRRVLRGERWHQPHRSHAYQRAAHRLGSHETVVRALLGGNLLLVGLAALAVWSPSLLPISVGSALTLALGIYAVVEARYPMYDASDSSRPD